MKDQDFPPLGESKKPRQAIWNHVQTEVRTEDSLCSKILLLINENLVAMHNSNIRIEEKLEKLDIKLNQTALDTELHQTTIIKLIEYVHLLIQHTIWPVTQQINPALLNCAAGLQSVYDKLVELKTNVCKDYKIRRKRAESPPMQNISPSTAEEINTGKILNVLNEWYSSKSLNSVLNQWENNRKTIHSRTNVPLKLICYNVEGWGTRAPEVIELVYKTEESICIFTEVGELWNTNKLPHFNIFYQKGTNHSGGVCIAVAKHLKASRIEIDIPNTVVIDITGLSESVRIIGIYWPNSQKRNLDDILPLIVEGTILTGDFNATVREWSSPATDKRGAVVKDWIEENNLKYIPSTSHSSKRSMRNIDLSFSNMTTISCETLHLGTSDHWPIVLMCENIFFDMKGTFSHTNWRAFEAILVLL
ncbi:unnamed protein product [Rotaria magnacalcarata]|uniref:Endonuclease/exonuclease/phosphatase domain-containing protein n=1 Tax=Rotaria magnacalcarata TaxID=392030 RepID=A0A816GMV9_9BILA|nr:unnamed protein product [Rotaria magnacalcarata]